MKFSAILTKRLKGDPSQDKMGALAQRSSEGHLSGFSGVFRMTPISKQEETSLENILKKYEKETTNIESDLKQLIQITAEVKAINNQAAMLHGERIKNAQRLLSFYHEGR